MSLFRVYRFKLLKVPLLQSLKMGINAGKAVQMLMRNLEGSFNKKIQSSIKSRAIIAFEVKWRHKTTWVERPCFQFWLSALMPDFYFTCTVPCFMVLSGRAELMTSKKNALTRYNTFKVEKRVKAHHDAFALHLYYARSLVRNINTYSDIALAFAQYVMYDRLCLII